LERAAATNDGTTRNIMKAISTQHIDFSIFSILHRQFVAFFHKIGTEIAKS
jgi:hypothetical protein